MYHHGNDFNEKDGAESDDDYVSANGPHSVIGPDLDDDGYDDCDDYDNDNNDDCDNDDNYDDDCDDYVLCLSQWPTLCQCEEWKQLLEDLDGKT